MGWLVHATPSSKMVSVVKMKDEPLDELVRSFLNHLPNNDLMTLSGQLELAYWHYLDLMRPDDPSLPACSFKEFTATILQHCPSLSPGTDASLLVEQWKVFKHSRPVRGAILLNPDLTKCILVQGYPASTSWSFPKGKKENNESDIAAAIREVYEEVGFRINDLIRSDQYLEVKQKDLDSRMYIITNVLETLHFEPVARKEIRRIQWFNIKDLPSHRHDETSKNSLKMSANKFYIVIPFIGPLRQWITKNRKLVADQHAVHHTTLQPFVSPSNYIHYPLHLLMTLKTLRPSQSWCHFKFDTDCVMKAYHSN